MGQMQQQVDLVVVRHQQTVLLIQAVLVIPQVLPHRKVMLVETV